VQVCDMRGPRRWSKGWAEEMTVSGRTPHGPWTTRACAGLHWASAPRPLHGMPEKCRRASLDGQIPNSTQNTDSTPTHCYANTETIIAPQPRLRTASHTVCYGLNSGLRQYMSFDIAEKGLLPQRTSELDASRVLFDGSALYGRPYVCPSVCLSVCLSVCRLSEVNPAGT
jgi:hypothetical protein